MRSTGLALLLALAVALAARADEPSLLLGAQLAQADASEIAFWQSVRQSDDPEELRAYLEAYPDGHFSALARIRLKRLASGPDAADAAGAAVGGATGSGLDPVAMAGLAFQHGAKLLAEGDLERALPFLEIAVSRDPSKALYHHALGDLYLSFGSELSSVLAIEAYRRALAIDPERRLAYAGLRQAALLADDPILALEVTETLFTWEGGTELAYLTDLTALAIVVDRPDRAIDLLERALPSAAGERDRVAAIKLNLAALHEYKGELPAAIGLTREVLDDAQAESRTALYAQGLIDRWSAE